MNKKELTLLMLQKIAPVWLPAEGLIVLLQKQEIDTQTLEAIHTILSDALQKTQSLAVKAKLAQGAMYLQQLMQTESLDKEKEKKELEQLENLIDTM